MRKGGGKSKGSSFERKICVRLSLWLSDGNQEDLFWRSAMSGGRATVASWRGADLATQAGDISAVHPYGHVLTSKFVIEIKHLSNIDFDSAFLNRGILVSVWKDVYKKAKFHKRLPMLIIKQNYMPIIVCVNELGLSLIGGNSLTQVEFPQLDMKVVLLETLLTHTPSRLFHFELKDALTAFRSHKCGATQRGIEFEFEFDSWVLWWEEKLGPKWQEKRGNRKGQYVMARNEDKGPYAVWNVECKLSSENISEKAKNGTAAKGEQIATNKLLRGQIIDIFYDERSYNELATIYGVDRTYIWMIKKKRTWKWLLEDLPPKRSRNRVRLQNQEE